MFDCECGKTEKSDIFLGLAKYTKKIQSLKSLKKD